MIADNFGIKILQVSALAPKDFSQSYLPLSNVCPRHSLTSCVLGNDTGSNTWTPVNDTIDFILRVRSSLLRLSAMTESSFGRIIATTNAAGVDISANPVVRTAFTYTGREYEDESGMFYYRARYYSPTTGRFLQSDPDPGKLTSPVSLNNKYIYALNMPIIGKDPTGRFFWLAFLINLSINFVSSGIAHNWNMAQVFNDVLIGLAIQAVTFGLGYGAGSLGKFLVGDGFGKFLGASVGAAFGGFAAARSGAGPLGIFLGAFGGGMGGFAGANSAVTGKWPWAAGQPTAEDAHLDVTQAAIEGTGAVGDSLLKDPCVLDPQGSYYTVGSSGQHQLNYCSPDFIIGN